MSKEEKLKEEKLKKEIGERLRKIRNVRGLSQENLANDLRITSTAYGKIERGETDVNVTRLSQICEILEIHLYELFIPEHTINHIYNNDEPILEPDINKKKLSHQTDLDIAIDRITELKNTIQVQKELNENLKLRIAYLEKKLNKNENS